MTDVDGSNFLYSTAALVGLVHTLLGPDHYLPFVAMSRAGGWSLRRTIGITLLCGVGHVLGSVVIGVVGIAFGIGVLSLEGLEEFRGNLAGWLMLAFGLAYFAWGMRRAIRHRPHTHVHVHADGTVHAHPHVHTENHVHVHASTNRTDSPASGNRVTPWVLFTLFLFGPCEPLIPILMYPAANGSILDVAMVTLIFASATVLTMTIAVVAGCTAVHRMPAIRWRGMAGIERYGHALAGAAVLACGAAVLVGL